MEVADMATGFVAIGARRLIATRLDIARRFGGLIAAASVPGVSFTEVSISPHVADGLTAINPVPWRDCYCPNRPTPKQQPT
ncbi:MAG: hypothetical protein HC814_08730 [Rhodobacteraceae bacterium]|nr:hypothetical protein [Paracoccaceae bacterium]